MRTFATITATAAALITLLGYGFYYFNPVALAFNQPIHFYGKIVDQAGNPIPDVTIKGVVMRVHLPMQMQPEYSDSEAKSDINGVFVLSPGSGGTLMVRLIKPGYEFHSWHDEFNYSEMSPENERFKPDASSPVVFRMWKLRGASSVKKFSGSPGITPDGKEHAFDLMTGRFAANDGNMVIVVTRAPSIDKVPYDWEATIRLKEGGFVPIPKDDDYPNEAPEAGYTPEIDIRMPRTTRQWSESFDSSYYFEANGKYGRITIDLFSNLPIPMAGISGWINPSGSRNLETPDADSTLGKK